MLAALAARGVRSVFVRYLRSLPGEPTADGVLAAIAATLAWGPADGASGFRATTAESLPWWLRLFGTAIGASVDAGPARRGTILRAAGRSEILRAALAHRDGVPRAVRARAAAGGSVRDADAGRPAADQRPRCDHRAGREGRRVGRRAGDAAAGPAQQGDGRIPHPLRLRARRQRLRGRRVPARALRRCRAARSR